MNEKSYKEMLDLEFRGPQNALHQNKGESGLTFMGIYEKAFPFWLGWSIIKQNLSKDFKKSSILCYNNEELKKAVFEFYKKEFWDKLKLDEVKNEKVAGLIFKTSVNVGVKAALKLTFEITQTNNLSDTLKALNKTDPDTFTKAYKEKLKEFYINLATKKPQTHGIFLKGWLNRVEKS